MTTIAMDRIGRLFISLQQIKQAPRMLAEAAPSMPNTVRDADVPPFFRERFVRSGYRPLHQRWRYYFLSAFQRHNETVNIWTHLLALLVLLVKLRQAAEMVDFAGDRHSWPLLVLIVSAINYTVCSVVAHLLGGKSELCHYTFFFLDYVGVAQYQYGSVVVHYYYTVEEDFYSRVHRVFIPVAVLLSWCSCLGCCYGKYRNHSLPSWVRKVGQVTPSSLAYMWDISPVMHRLFSTPAGQDDPAAIYHLGHIGFFIGCAFFFAFPVLERIFPGRCDILGQSHQLFHLLLSCCTMFQIQASHLDYMGRREVYERLHGSGDAALLAGVYVLTWLVCLLIAAFMLWKTKRLLDRQAKLK
ncbi:progestin and adipoQ receptor family member VII, a [Nerophis ophidion]|uniref:progestin and adipoQ receptor family member VII, a n=1 Tax=Nerophis ophidion TaxID=159077 RepID=UPI002AE0A1B6|nr:progestin and adipoQ receptor family member VII, a [Nerophis ophidion]